VLSVVINSFIGAAYGDIIYDSLLKKTIEQLDAHLSKQITDVDANITKQLNFVDSIMQERTKDVKFGIEELINKLDKDLDTQRTKTLKDVAALRKSSLDDLEERLNRLRDKSLAVSDKDLDAQRAKTLKDVAALRKSSLDDLEERLNHLRNESLAASEKSVALTLEKAQSEIQKTVDYWEAETLPKVLDKIHIKLTEQRQAAIPDALLIAIISGIVVAIVLSVGNVIGFYLIMTRLIKKREVIQQSTQEE
jgi:hypothetical protein